MPRTLFNIYDRLLKNRKSARKSRKRRKAELYTLKDELKALKQENERLKSLLKNSNGGIETAAPK